MYAKTYILYRLWFILHVIRGVGFLSVTSDRLCIQRSLHVAWWSKRRCILRCGTLKHSTAGAPDGKFAADAAADTEPKLADPACTQSLAIIIVRVLGRSPIL